MEYIQWASRFIVDGGVFMYLILAVLVFSVAIAFERLRKLSFTYDVDGASFMNELQRYVLSNDIQGAIRICSGTTAALPKVLKSGLKRANQPTDQIQNAIDATALEMIPKIEKRLGYLSLAANISTLLGLLGTIQGLIISFSAASAANPAQKNEVLSKGMAIAMNSTAMGLTVAIIIMMVHAFLMSKSEKIICEIDEFSVKLLDLLGSKKPIDD